MRMMQHLRALARNRSGVAIIEFALVAPVLMLMYCGAYVVSDMVTCGRKVSLAARSITDLGSQYASLTSAQAAAILTNSAYVIAPYSSTNASMRISEIQVTDASHAIVVWSNAPNSTALAIGTVINLPKNMAPVDMQPNLLTLTPGSYFIMGEVSYSYTPAFGMGWLPSPSLYNRYFMLPRVSTSVQYIP
jgi:Flp pilus assembly protein TadG